MRTKCGSVCAGPDQQQRAYTQSGPRPRFPAIWKPLARAALGWVLLVLASCSPMVYTRGVPNLALVDAGVYRSGQITSAEGWDTVAKLARGRRVHVVKLNSEHEGTDAPALGRGWELLYLPIQPEGDQDIWDDLKGLFTEPDEAVVQRALDELRMCQQHPDTDVCFVHCTHGQDRTGYVVGRFRVADDSWTAHRAFAEMIQHDFHSEIVGLVSAWWKHTGPVE